MTVEPLAKQSFCSTDIGGMVKHTIKLLERKHGRVLVALAGIPGVGKSTLSSAISEQLTAEGIATVVLPQDGYHYYLSELEKFPDPANAVFK